MLSSGGGRGTIGGMHSLLLVDDQDSFRNPLAEALREQGYEVREAATAPQALEMAMRRKPDLMLLDVAMPNIDGFELLRYFRGRAVFRMVPVIFLTAYARRDFLAQAATMGVKDYLLKSSFSLEDLLHRIESHLGSAFQGSASSAFRRVDVVPQPETPAVPAAAAPQHPTRHDPRDLLQHISVRSFPESVSEILALAGDPHSSLTQMESVLRRDPVLAAQVMVAANASPLRRGLHSATLEDALRTLGMTQVVRIVSTVSVLKPEELSAEWGRDIRRLWSHCIAAAMVSQRLHETAQEAYGFLLGLLHELPELLCMAQLKGDWEEWKTRGEAQGWTLSVTLGHAFGADFYDLSRQILTAMRMPETLSLPLREYHGFYLSETPLEPGPEARTIDVAHQFATVLGRSGSPLTPVSPIRADLMRRFRSPGTLGLDLLPLDSQVLQWEMMSGMRDDPVSAFPSDPLRILYWRSESWFSPDPIETLLQKTGHAQRVDDFSELQANVDLKIVLAEPGSPEWGSASELRGRVLVLHRGVLGSASAKTMRTLRLPVTEAMLSALFQEL